LLCVWWPSGLADMPLPPHLMQVSHDHIEAQDGCTSTAEARQGVVTNKVWVCRTRLQGRDAAPAWKSVPLVVHHRPDQLLEAALAALQAERCKRT
jgi:hypothetical protein